MSSIPSLKHYNAQWCMFLLVFSVWITCFTKRMSVKVMIYESYSRKPTSL